MKDFSLFIKQCCLIIWTVKKKTESKNPRAEKTKSGGIILSSKSAYGSKKSKFIKEQ